MTNERHGTEIGDALTRLRDHVAVPPIDPDRERSLLAVFDTHWASSNGAMGQWGNEAMGQWGNGAMRNGRTLWTTAAAALIAIAVGLNWLVATEPQRTSAPISHSPVDMTGFVPWPDAQALPPFESGQLMRVDLPEWALPALGLPPQSSAGGVVEAEIVVGQDGLARAFRLVQQ